MKNLIKMLACVSGWLFLLYFLSPTANAQQPLWQYSIYFQEDEDALPSMADLDSLKQLAAIALKSDTQQIVIRPYVDYWRKDDRYYTLLRKRSYLLRQIFEREGLGPERLQLIQQALELPENAELMRHRIDVLIQQKDSVVQETEVNYYAEIRSFLNQLIREKKEAFRIRPDRDTILYTQRGAMLYIPKHSFRVARTTAWIELSWQDALHRSELLPYILLSPELEQQLQEWAAVWNLEARVRGRPVALEEGAEIVAFLPTDDVLTDLTYYHSSTEPSRSFQWKAIGLEAWPSNSALCLHLADAETENFVYYCTLRQLAKPKPAPAPSKPQKPILEQADTVVLQTVDSLLALNEMVRTEIREAFQRKEAKRWVRKKKRLRQEQQYQRELEAALRQKRSIERKKKEELDRVKAVNDERMADYKKEYAAYSRLRDSLQQAYLSAVWRWKVAGDSLKRLCAYEKDAVAYLRQAWGDSLMQGFRVALRKARDPELLSPAAQPLFPTGHQHLILPIRKLGWSSLQRERRVAKTLEYKAFTFGPELPSYKILALTMLEQSRTVALATGLDLDNISFNPLPSEAPICLIALYVDGEKAFLNLHKATANKLPYKLEFEEYQDLEALQQALKALDR